MTLWGRMNRVEANEEFTPLLHSLRNTLVHQLPGQVVLQHSITFNEFSMLFVVVIVEILMEAMKRMWVKVRKNSKEIRQHFLNCWYTMDIEGCQKGLRILPVMLENISDHSQQIHVRCDSIIGLSERKFPQNVFMDQFVP